MGVRGETCAPSRASDVGCEVYPLTPIPSLLFRGRREMTYKSLTARETGNVCSRK